MNRRTFIHGAGLAVLAASGRRIAPRAWAAIPTVPDDLGGLLETIRKANDLPGLAAAVVRGDRAVAEGVAGVRRVGGDDRITLDDRFPIGSCTKRMTAVMVGRLIDVGRLSFDTTLADALPGTPMRDEYRPVTVAQLLTFTGGLPTYTQVGPQMTPILFELKGSSTDRREQFVKHVLREPPVVKPGTERRYSNASYAVLAFVAARRTEREWEALIRDEVYKPLGMTRSGFGRPRIKDRPNEPTAHRKTDKGFEQEPENAVEPLAALAGAGGVHCSIRDLAKFASYELSAAQGRDALLKPATVKRWQQLSRPDQVDGRPIVGGTPWVMAGYVLWPSKDTAVAVAANAGAAGEAREAVFRAARERYVGSDK
jgi:D-alanyl-D-alanine carboxypeptidase